MPEANWEMFNQKVFGGKLSNEDNIGMLLELDLLNLNLSTKVRVCHIIKLIGQ